MRLFFLLCFIPWLSTLAGCGQRDSQLFYFGFGGQDSVSGSLHALKYSNQFYLIDVGIYFGDEGQNYPWPEELPVSKIAAVFITHAHMDHVGRLPLLLKKGYSGPIFMTRPTYDLLKVTLQRSLLYADFGNERFYYAKANKFKERIPVYLEGYYFDRFNVDARNRVYISSKRSKLSEQGFYLNFSQIQKLRDELSQRLKNQVEIIEFDQAVEVGPFIVHAYHTSHIPGSAMLGFHHDQSKILFSGDVGGNRHPLLRHNVTIEEQYDVLFLEGTYPRDRNIEKEVEIQNFKDLLGYHVSNNYRVIVPAFVMDRSHIILHYIHQAMEDGIIPKETHVTVYSQTTWDLNPVYKGFKNKSKDNNHFSLEIKNLSFDFQNLKQPRPRGSLEIELGEIAIMGSAMGEFSFAATAIDKYALDKNTAFVFTGYLAPESPAYTLTMGVLPNKEGVSIPVSAKTYRTSSMSGHADPSEIIRVFGKTNPEQIFLVHLDRENADELVARYSSEFSAEIILPQSGQEFILSKKSRHQEVTKK